MADLKSLGTPLTDLTHDELLSRIREIREDRKISKYAVTQRAARAGKKKKSIDNKLAALLKGMSEEEIAAIMEENS